MRSWQLILIFLIVPVIVLGGCSKVSTSELDYQSVVTAPPVTAPPAAAVYRPRNARIRAVTLGHSVQGEPLVMYVLGSGANPIFIFGGIHGHEPTAAQLAEKMLRLLRENPHLRAGVPVAILPAANPNGLAKGNRHNANGVDCNRNFAASNWRRSRPGHRYYGGPKPLSEPETRAIVEAVRSLRPGLIVSIHSFPGGGFCNNYDGPGPAQDVAELMANYNGYPPKASIGYPTPGSFGSWAGIDLGIPTITLELPREKSFNQIWPSNRDALLAVFRAYGRQRY